MIIREVIIMNLKPLLNGFASFAFSFAILSSESRIIEVISILGIAINFVSIRRI